MSTLVQLAGRPLTVRLARVALWFVLVVTVLLGLSALIGGIADLAKGATTVTLVADRALPSGVSGNVTRVTSGRYDSATVALVNATPTISTLSLLSAIGNIVAHLALAGAVGVVVWHVLRPRLFRRSLSRQFTVMGILVFLGGVLWQAGGMFAAGLTAVALDAPRNRGFWPLAGRLDPTYIVVGLAFVVIALAFEFGGRLQKETEGLV